MNPVTRRARRLRREQTPAEATLWRLIRGRHFGGYKFRRQVPIGRYTLDFYCPEARLAVEADGNQHGFPGPRQHDAERDAYLAGQGIEVVRFGNRDILTRRDFVAVNLWQKLQARAPHPENLPETSQGFRAPERK